jgi:hypothetical protein
MDGSGETEEAKDQRPNAKPIVHVPPRVDQEYYQCEVPETKGAYEGGKTIIFSPIDHRCQSPHKLNFML